MLRLYCTTALLELLWAAKKKLRELKSAYEGIEVLRCWKCLGIKSHAFHLLGHPQRGGLCGRVCLYVCCGHSLRLRMSGWSSLSLGWSLDFLKTFWGISEESWGLSRDFRKTFQGLSRDFLRSFWGLSEDFLGTFWGLSTDFLRTFFFTFLLSF